MSEDLVRACEIRELRVESFSVESFSVESFGFFEGALTRLREPSGGEREGDVGDGLNQVRLVGGEDDGAAGGAVGVRPGAEVGEEIDDGLGGGDVEI
jgi:hypothetical protein